MPPEEPSGEDAPPERRPPAHHKTEHRHPHGWRIDPGPDGRGTPDKESSAPPGLGWRFLLILVFLLAVNVTVVSLIGPEQKTQRVRIPYSPVFLTQVREGNVKSISSKGETVQGELRRPVRYPPSDRKATRTTHFNTEVPTFANADKLDSLLERKGVVMNAKPPQEGRSLIETLLLSFGPTLLLVGLFVFLIRRAAGGAGAAWAASAAHAPGGWSPPSSG